MSQKLTTRELMYSIRRALRLRYDTVEERRAGKRYGHWGLTLTDSRDYIKKHVNVPRGQGIKADALLQQLLAVMRKEERRPLLEQRLLDYKLKVYTQEIRSRGGETSIRGKTANTYVPAHRRPGRRPAAAAGRWVAPLQQPVRCPARPFGVPVRTG